MTNEREMQMQRELGRDLAEAAYKQRLPILTDPYCNKAKSRHELIDKNRVKPFLQNCNGKPA
ncbi:hypothetical protein [Chitinivorax sp. B]|uniref:hypothetical protein n=1 Tax=Chitinivorax sp. B TaxID=2502235 RepID=UPI0010F66EC3|nr:hypothetical protein [Chitinivorax sp. B]